MMSLTRRDFLKIGCLSLAALALRPPDQDPAPWKTGSNSNPRMRGRITRRDVPIYAQPDLDSPRLNELKRDALVNLLDEVDSPYGPPHNPRWYRLPEGYLHSGHVQRVEAAHQNSPLSEVPVTGVLGEITVPYTQVQYHNRQGEWIPLYRLYYGSVHWITGLEESRSGEVLYHLTDERLRVRYRVPAAHLRPVMPHEYTPLSANVPPEEKRIEVSLARQTLTAYEGREIVREVNVSTGQRYTPTRPGESRVDRKFPSRHMGDGVLTSDLRAYELLGVPWVSFFQTAGIAFHGTYWHDNFGAPMSQGCVNLRNTDALWLFRWTAPVYLVEHADRPTWKVTGKDGTVVVVV